MENDLFLQNKMNLFLTETYGSYILSGVNKILLREDSGLSSYVLKGVSRSAKATIFVTKARLITETIRFCHL